MMAVVFYAFFISKFWLVESDLINCVKGTNEKCCKDKFSNDELKKCQDGLEKQLRGSLLEEDYKKKKGNFAAQHVENLIANACKDVKEEISQLEVTPEEYGFLIAACSTHNNNARKSFLKYFADHKDKLEEAAKLNASYFQLLYEYDDQYVDKMNKDSNFAETLFSEKFREYFYTKLKEGKIKIATANPVQDSWWRNLNIFNYM